MRRDKIGFVFQDYYLIDHLTGCQNVMLPGLMGVNLGLRKIEERAKELMASLNVSHLFNRYPDALSGGEKQRICIARAFFKSPEIVLADEISPDTCRLWDTKTEKKLDKDRFRKDLGNIIQAYQEVARRLGIMPEETNISEVNFGKTIPIKFKKK